MTSRKTFRFAIFALASMAFAPVPFVVVACSSDNSNPAPAPTYTNDATVPQADGSPSSTATQEAAAPEAGPAGGDDGSTDVVEEPIVREDAQACLLGQSPALGAPDAGCWSCAAQVASDFLNKCSGTGVTCVPYDNGRLPGYDGGALPPTN